MYIANEMLFVPKMPKSHKPTMGREGCRGVAVGAGEYMHPAALFVWQYKTIDVAQCNDIRSSTCSNVVRADSHVPWGKWRQTPA